MKERGIIFNADMVRAILDGRKTQTRRIMKPQPTPCDYIDWRGNARGGHVWPSNIFRTMLHVEGELQNGDGGWKGLVGDTCPFGDIDDRLWVREAFQVGLCTESTIAYKATHKPSDLEEGWHEKIKWRPSIHMPRWASRILLEITGVRVERLQSTSEEDAKAEGFDNSQSDAANSIGWFEKPIRAFRRAWENIYGADGWDSNPWVWVIEFRRVTP
ncbi:hypothetical protein ACR2Y1_001923 [Morganella morganii]|uniref:hypothetical protein n=1 Tax=Morganella morganii TaxID=582 RepID=UPI000D8D13A7|nr:hypothetical protein [Morganella morganii]MBS9543697.1 hypothetical protein [Morganella morganii subsp. morganii]MBT0459865.1 hypothetical protein [Morganella morganii subsp. morganii]SPX74566.1 Uncharacterised protein [Morganella morganii]HEI8511679.1 hypothetical protein [Morganella morganii]